jgi:hypothetical protein
MDENKKPLIIYGADSDLAKEVKGWMDSHAGGDWRLGIKMLLDWAELKPILSSLFQELEDLRELVRAHLAEHEKKSNEPDEDGVKTFGGIVK